MVTCPTPLGSRRHSENKERRVSWDMLQMYNPKNAESAKSFFKLLFFSLFFWRSWSKKLCALGDILRPRARNVQEYNEHSALIVCHRQV